MLQVRNHKIKKYIRSILPFIVLAVMLYSCASIGHPDGGPEDITPPRFLSSTPVMGAVNNTKKKVVLEFDEFIKLVKASEKVIISPPQLQQPEIKAVGKKVQINLLDTLKPNTTYTIDFSDAIVDNNADNPLGNFTYTFSTGAQIDTMEVSGTVLDASNLEPIKGILVGLHANLNDSAFTKLPFERVGRTDSRGRFSIRGIAPGKYRIFALMDADQNFSYSQKSEVLAFNDSIIIPTMEGRTRMDTAWVDSLTYDTIIEKKYTHYLPDDIILRAFKEKSYSQYLVKSERLIPQKFSFYFAAEADTLPVLKGLNFDEKDAFILEKNQRNDTLHFWVKDSLLYKKDTLSMSLTYLYTDTLNRLIPRTDTLNLVSKQKTLTKEEPQQKKKKKKKGEEDLPEPTKFLPVNIHAPSSMDVYDYISLQFEEPVVAYDTAAIHLRQKVDSLWKDVPFEFEHDSTDIRKFNLYYDWEYGTEYEFTVDSTAFHGLYGLFTDKIKQSIKAKTKEEYAQISFTDLNDVEANAFIELLDSQDKVVRRRRVANGRVDFYFLNPGKYYARLINDRNGNGVWDPGNYEKGIQPEEVYYYSETTLEPKANWELEQRWSIHSKPLDKQKPDELKKQKPDEDRKQKNRNQNRTNNTRR